MKLLLTIVLAVALMAVVAQAVITAEQVETTVETAVGGVAATYLELTKTGGGTGDTKDGLTLVTADNTWAYPDGSDNNIVVSGNCLDEDPWNGGGGTGAANFQATISGLVHDADYELFVVAVGRPSGTEDFSWGTVNASPDLANFVTDISNVPGAIQMPVGENSNYDFAVSVGTYNSGVSGVISIWLGKAGTFVDPEYRTQFDGLVVTREVSNAYDPIPVDDATNVSRYTDLSWNVPTDANTNADSDWVYKVYFGTNSALAVTPITVGPNVGGSRLTVTNAQIGGPLTLYTEYFWRVKTVDPNGPTTRDGSSLWSFTDGCTLPTLIDPNDTYDEDVEVNVSLLWSSDPLAITHNVVVTPDGGSPVTLVNKTSGFTPYGNMTMEWNKKYTWQIIEKNAGGVTIATGPVWKFKVRALNCNDPAPLAADADGDCIVNLADFAIMASEWLDCNWDDGGLASPCP